VIAKEKHGQLPLSRKPVLAWYAFAVEGKASIHKLKFDYDSAADGGELLRFVIEPPSERGPLGKQNVSFAPSPFQEVAAARLTHLAKEATDHLLAVPPRAKELGYVLTPFGTVVDKEILYLQLEPIRSSLERQRLASLMGSLRSLESILTAADYLGVPYGGRAGHLLLWLADAALCPVVPLGWQEWPSAENAEPMQRHSNVRSSDPSALPLGRPYYQNVLTGETTWEHPQISILRGIATSVADRLGATNPKGAGNKSRANRASTRAIGAAAGGLKHSGASTRELAAMT